MASEVIAIDRQYPKLSKAASGYLEIDHFKNADLHTGYFCYNCIYWINAAGGKCMLVEDEGPDVKGKVSSIAPTAAAWYTGQTMTSRTTPAA